MERGLLEDQVEQDESDTRVEQLNQLKRHDRDIPIMPHQLCLQNRNCETQHSHGHYPLVNALPAKIEPL